MYDMKLTIHNRLCNCKVAHVSNFVLTSQLSLILEIRCPTCSAVFQDPKPIINIDQPGFQVDKTEQKEPVQSKKGK